MTKIIRNIGRAACVLGMISLTTGGLLACDEEKPAGDEAAAGTEGLEPTADETKAYKEAAAKEITAENVEAKADELLAELAAEGE